MSNNPMIRSQNDLERVGRALGYHFKTDAVVVIGSQSVLVGWPEAPEAMRTSSEIDAYPANYREWQSLPENIGLEASEEINALFGNGSHFHSSHGFYIDGVDSDTAQLPDGWQERAVYREIDGVGQPITIIAPSVPDMAVSKLIRLVEKDRDWLSACHDARPFDIPSMASRLDAKSLATAVRQRALAFLMSLPKKDAHERTRLPSLPAHDRATHCLTVLENDGSLVVRAWDEQAKVYRVIDNPLGPAVVTNEESLYFLDGVPMPFAQWQLDLRVMAAQDDMPPKP